jgi:hypothetical protein
MAMGVSVWEGNMENANRSFAEIREVEAAAEISEQIVTIDQGNLLDVLQAAESWANRSSVN